MRRYTPKLIVFLSFLFFISFATPSATYAGYGKIIFKVARVILTSIAEEIVDRQVASKIVDNLITQTENRRYQIASIDLEQNQKQEYMELNKEMMLALQEMQTKISDQSLTDEELQAQIKDININKIQPLADKMERIEDRLCKVENQLKIHDEAIESLEQNVVKLCDNFENNSQSINSIEIGLKDFCVESQQKWDSIEKEISLLHEEDTRINRRVGDLSTRVDELILTNFSIYHTSLKFQSDYWNEVKNPEIPTNGHNFHYEGIGAGISLQIEKRVRLMGDIYYINPDVNISNTIDETKNNYKLAGLQVKGYSMSGIAHLTFFSKNGLGIEGGGGYQWSEYTMQTDQTYQKINEKGIILSGGVTLMKEHYSIWMLMQTSARKKEFYSKQLKIGLSVIL